MSFTQHQRSVCSVGHVGFGRGTTAGRRGAWRLARSGKSKMALKKGSNWMELVDAPWFCTIFHFFLSDDCSMCFFFDVSYVTLMVWCTFWSYKCLASFQEFLLEKPLQQLYIAEASPSKASWCDWVNDGIHMDSYCSGQFHGCTE